MTPGADATLLLFVIPTNIIMKLYLNSSVSSPLPSPPRSLSAAAASAAQAVAMLQTKPTTVRAGSFTNIQYLFKVCNFAAVVLQGKQSLKTSVFLCKIEFVSLCYLLISVLIKLCESAYK